MFIFSTVLTVHCKFTHIFATDQVLFLNQRVKLVLYIPQRGFLTILLDITPTDRPSVFTKCVVSISDRNPLISEISETIRFSSGCVGVE